MWHSLRRRNAALCAVLFAGCLFPLSEATELPLQSPVFRSSRLDFEVKNPVTTDYDRPLSIASAFLEDLDGNGRSEILVFNDPCSSLSPGVYRIALTPQGMIQSTTGTRTNKGCLQYGGDGLFGEVFTAGDYDRNGFVDFVSWGAAALYLRGSDGTVTERSISLPLDPVQGSFHLNDYVITGDVNRDGIPDALVAQEFFIFEFSGQDFKFRDSTNLYVFLADGHGGFVRNQKIEALDLPGLDFKLMPGALKDFTGDGIVDYLGFGSGPRGSWEILPGDGAGHFLPPDQGIAATLPNEDLQTPVMAAGDLNGDGLADLFLRQGGLRVSTGVGQWSGPQALSKPYLAYGPIGFQDVNGDGRLDLQFFNGTVAVTYLTGEDGHLGSPQELSLPLRPTGSLRMRWDGDPVADQVYFGDPDYHGFLGSPTLSVFPSPNGTSDSFRITPPWPNGAPAAVGDLDGDGHKDLLFAGAEIVVYRGNGRGDFRPVTGALTPSGVGSFDALAVDLNHDGRDDVVTLSYTPVLNGAWTLSSYLGQPPGNAPVLLQTKDAGAAPMKIAAGDVNGDGNIDLLETHRGVTVNSGSFYVGGTVSLYPGESGGRFGDPATVIGGDPPFGYPAAIDVKIGQVNGDEFPDLVLLFSSLDLRHVGIAAWADGLGGGRFTEPYVFHTNGGGTLFQVLPPADVNGDGMPDLGFSPAYLGQTGTFGTFLGHAGEEFFSRFAIPSTCCVNPGRHVDLDGDGFLDLLGSAGESLQFGGGTGTGEFHARGPRYSPSGYPLIHGYPGLSPSFIPPVPLFADFNEDGREDVVVSDSTGPILLLNRSNRVASDPAESLGEGGDAAHPIDPEIDLAEIQARIGSFDFSGSGRPQGALVFTLSLNDRLPGDEESEPRLGGPGQVLGDEVARPGTASPARDHRSATFSPEQRARPKLKSGTFQLFFNCGEPLLDSNRDGSVDLSIANAKAEPGLAGIPLADVSLSLRLDGGGPPFTGLHDINRFSTVDRDRGVATFVIPYDALLAALTPAERAALDQGDGTGRIFFWAVSRRYGDRDRVPDTDDGSDPTIRSEVGEFRFPFKDLRVTPELTFKDVIITKDLDAPLTFANHGVTPIEIGSVELPDSTLSLNAAAPFAVPPAGRRNLRLRYAPIEHKSFDGLGTVRSDDPAKTTFQLSLSGRGVAPIAQVSTESVDFGSTPIGMLGSDPYTKFIIVHNAGDTWLDITWDITDPYAQFSRSFDSYSLPEPADRFMYLRPGDTGGFLFYFRPTQLGPAEATFRMETNDPFHPRFEVRLHGTGTPAEPRIIIDRYYSEIANVPMGGEGSTDFAVHNNGTVPLHILSATSTRPEFTARVQPETLPPSSSGALTVTYRPVAWGKVTTTITVTSDDPTQPALSFLVNGTAFEPPPKGTVSPTRLDFGEVHQGDSVTRSFDLSNAGGGPLRITGPSPIVSPSCPLQTDIEPGVMILPGESRTFHVTFTADISKPFCGRFYLATNDPILGSVPIDIVARILSGQISYAPTALGFPVTSVGSSSTVNLGIFNSGQEPLRITRATFTQPYFSLGAPLPDPIPPGVTVLLPFVFTPTRVGYLTGYVELSTNDLDHPTVRIFMAGDAFPALLLKSPSDSLEK